MKWPLPRPRWLFLLPLLTIPLAAPVATFFGPARPLQLFDYLIAWLYGMFLIALLVGLALRSELIEAFIPARLPHFLRIFTRIRFGQTYGAWLLAFCAIALLAALLTTRVGPIAAQRAVWIKLALDLEPDAPAPLLLRYGAGAADTIAMKWQPYQATDLAVRALDGSPPPMIQKIATDYGEVKLRETTVRQGVLTKQGIVANGASGSLISWPRMARAIEITLAPGSGTTELLWYDQRVRVQLSQQPTKALLRLPTKLQGWAMLPAQTIDHLGLELPPGERTYRFTSIHVFSNRPQAWAPSGPRWFAQGCVLDQQDQAIIIQTHAESGCVVLLPDVRPLNSIDPATIIGIWVLIALVLFSGLVVWTVILRRVQQYLRGHPLRLAPAVSHPILAPRWIMLVWGIALAWHLIYALTVPIASTNDSLNYYEIGRSIPQMTRMANYWSERAPGYPIVIALIRGIFGDTALWLIVFQQLALSLLAPLAMWVVAGRVAPLIAILSGLAVGISPAMSMASNFIHTEAIYTLCMVAALLIYAKCGAYPRVLLACGVLIGVGTLHRPAGAIVLVVLAAWLLLLGWHAPAASGALRRALIGIAALTISYIVLAGPWHIYLALARHTFDPSDGRAAITLWSNVIKQRQIQASLPAFRPDRAVWELPETWANDPFELTFQHQQMMTSVIDLRQSHYFNETAREAMSAFPSRVRESQLVSLRYNLALWKLDSTTIFYWEDFNYFFDQWQQIDQTPPPVSTSNALGELMPLLTYRWMPQHSPIREACLALTHIALDYWGWVAMLALLSPITLLTNHRRLLPVWLYWIALVAASSVIGMPAQRYIVVCEPLIAMLALLSMDSLWLFGRHRFRTSATHSKPLYQ